MNKEELIELKEVAKDFAKSVEELTVEEANELLKKKSNEKILQERIDKAIAYIETGKTFLSDETRETVEYMQNILLDILKGSDTNV